MPVARAARPVARLAPTPPVGQASRLPCTYPLRPALRSVCAAFLLLTIALLTGCGNRAQRLYRRGDAFFARDQWALAAGDFEKLVQRYPRDPLADFALYKLGHIYTCTPLKDPRLALAAYDKLASPSRNPKLAGDALFWIARIGRTELQDPVVVRKAAERARTQFSKQPALGARIHLELARALYEARDQSCTDVCGTVLKAYADEPRYCAEAQLLLGMVAENLQKDRGGAIEAYERVLARYPQTPAARRAKEAIGWIYYGVRQVREGGRPTEAPPVPKLAVSGVPPIKPSRPGSPQASTAAVLRSLLGHAGVSVGLTDLLAASGIAFQFVYDSSDPQSTANVVPPDAVTHVTRLYGCEPQTVSSEQAEAGMQALQRHLAEQRPVLITYGQGQWAIVVGYDQGRQQVSVLTVGAGQPADVPLGEFVRKWGAATGEAAAPGLYFQLVLPAQAAPPDAATVVRTTIARASKLARQQRCLGHPAGLAAYDALAADLDRVGEVGVASAEADNLKQWMREPLAAHIANRAAAAAYLNAAVGSLPEPAGQALAQAAEAYRRVVAELKALRESLAPAAGSPSASAAPAFGAAAAQVRGIRAAEERAVQKLEAAAAL